jgi:hypothetical protein
MIVTLFYRSSYVGGDGWTWYPLTVEISDNCPKCGGKRGTPYPGRVIEDGETFAVQNWDNPCGHIDYYKDCYLEAVALAKAKKIP